MARCAGTNELDTAALAVLSELKRQVAAGEPVLRLRT